MTSSPHPPSSEIHIQDKVGHSSKLKSYQELVVGKTGWGSLIAYECIQLFASWVPGALGLFLRGKLYPLLLGECGKGCVFGVGVTLRHPHKIRLGDACVLDDLVLLDAKGGDNKGITLGDGVFIGRNSILSCKNGDIELEDEVNIGFNCEIFSGSRVRLGKRCLLAAYTYLIGGGHDFEDTEGDVLESNHVSKGIELDPGVWLGAGVQVLDGITIGRGSIVGAGAVVTASLEANSVSAGIPAKIKRFRNSSGSHD